MEPNGPRKALSLIGGGEHARVVADAAQGSGRWQVRGCFTPEPSASFEVLGADGDIQAREGEGYHLALVGAPGRSRRRDLLASLEGRGLQWATVIHASAVVADSAQVGEGAYVGARAVVNPGAVVGDHVIVNTGAILEHDVRIDTGVHVAPGSVLGGGVQVGAWAVLGLGCRIRDHVRIGEGAVIAMGAVVVGDVPAGAWMAGVPAKPMRLEVRHV